MLRVAIVVVLVAGCLPCAFAGEDWHVAPNTQGRTLFLRSPFLHGYMHGYEQGFHAADLDLQVGHDPRDPEKLDAFREVAGYERRFGDQKSFAKGYYQGFRVGYDDGTNLRPFRALSEVRAAGRGLLADRSVPSKPFDEALTTGYKQGVVHGRNDAGGGVARNALTPCHPADRSGEYCDAYDRGYRLGYSDGYVTQSPPVLAEKQKK